MDNCDLVKVMFWMQCSEVDLQAYTDFLTYLHKICAVLVFAPITSM